MRPDVMEGVPKETGGYFCEDPKIENKWYIGNVVINTAFMGPAPKGNLYFVSAEWVESSRIVIPERDFSLYEWSERIQPPEKQPGTNE